MTPNSPDSSNACATSVVERAIELGPTPLSRAVPIVLGLLAAIAVLMSAFPWVMKLPLAVAALAHAAWLDRRERGRSRHVLDFDGDPRLDGIVLRDARVELHGPWLTLVRKDDRGRWRRETWWCRLDAVNRRRLRLAIAGERHMLSPPMLAP
ncbi:MAG: hypothetical protein JF567_02795 [Xanthomonadales bacterium]|nr:hypothetical protein [Xanthomonadales bacterium]